MADRLGDIERTRAARFERALFRLVSRLHRDTSCGKDGAHWAECAALFTQLGWSGYESYAAEMQKLHADEGARVVRRQPALATGASEP